METKAAKLKGRRRRSKYVVGFHVSCSIFNLTWQNLSVWATRDTKSKLLVNTLVVNSSSVVQGMLFDHLAIAQGQITTDRIGLVMNTKWWYSFDLDWGLASSPSTFSRFSKEASSLKEQVVWGYIVIWTINLTFFSKPPTVVCRIASLHAYTTVFVSQLYALHLLS